ncbi:hypothetical protein SLA2020_440190 [Shorea laevis]
MDLLISETQALNWKDAPPPPLRPCLPEEICDLNLTLIGKLISLRTVPRSHVGLCLKKAWNFVEELSIADMGPNTFLFKFSSEFDIKNVLDSTPWNINGHPMFLQRRDPEIPLGDIDFDYGAYWIQIFGLPPDHMNSANAHSIGTWIGTLLDVDQAAKQGMQLAKCLRIKVLLNITKPLIQGFFLNRHGKTPTRISFKYERLSEFCFKCGKLGHIAPHCPTYPPPISDPPYSAALRATPLDNADFMVFQHSPRAGAASSSLQQNPPSFHSIISHSTLCIGGSMTVIPSQPAGSVSVKVSPTRTFPSTFIPSFSHPTSVGYPPQISPDSTFNTNISPHKSSPITPTTQASPHNSSPLSPSTSHFPPHRSPNTNNSSESL